MLNHLNVSDEIKKSHIQKGYHASGHMAYIDMPSAPKYHEDLTKFVRDSLPN